MTKRTTSTPEYKLRGRRSRFRISKEKELGKQTNWRVQAKVKAHKSSTLARVRVKARSGYYFDKKPYLKQENSNNSMALKPRAIYRDSKGRALTYYFYLVYKGGKREWSIANRMKLKIATSLLAIPTEKREITHINAPTKDFGSRGGILPISVYGTPGSRFWFTCTRKSDGSSLLETQEIDKSNTNDPTSILKTTTYVNPYTGAVIPMFFGTVGDDGVANCAVIIPSVVAKSTILTSGTSGAKAIQVVDTDGVMVNDRLFHKQINRYVPVKVNDISNTTTFNTDINVTLAADSRLNFGRNDEYHITFHARQVESDEIQTTWGTNIPTTQPTYIIKQYIEPTLVLKATEGEAWTLTATDINIIGKAGRVVNAKSGLRRRYKIRYTASHGSNFTVVRNPVFSAEDQTASDWTNSVPGDNGGTSVLIQNAKITGTGTQALVITADVYIYRWGYSDVTMTLNLDSLINV
tara:strand:- start:310 stop:1704 length:1395 start_codon:yes stop_codon:yes gene_type:complete